jgi:hypothetical protein
LSNNCRSSPPKWLPSPLPGETSTSIHLATDPSVSESPLAPRSPPAHSKHPILLSPLLPLILSSLMTLHLPLLPPRPLDLAAEFASQTSTLPDLRSTVRSYVATPRQMPACPIVLVALAHLIPSSLRSSLPCRYILRRPAIAALLALAAHRPPISSALAVYFSLFPISAAAAVATPPPLLPALRYWCGDCGAKRFLYSALPPQQAFDSYFVHSLLLQSPSQQHHVDQPL